MEIIRINPPKFKIGRYVLNEYELRQLQLDVVKGLKEGNIKVKCLNSNRTSILNEEGLFEPPLEGMGVSAGITLQILGYRRKIKNNGNNK